jgi:hypothetical protein
MDQKSIVLGLARKKLSTIAIHHNLAAILGPEAVGYSFVTRYLTRPSLFRPILLPIFPGQNLSSTIATRLFASHLPNSRLRQFESLRG